ncbi:MAG: acyltransferase [Robiginitomaculum sp.]|nr:acyltransferase [Robiginitomaculum sp.]
MQSAVKPFSIKYRPDIDGLRAVAVLAVVFYHFKIPPFSGGFVGVDIFFVISGYLITKLVWGQTKGGTFSFKTFYLRRIRRLFPALFVTLAGTLATAAILFSPEQMARLGKVSFFALMSLSNIVFWREAGYFDTDAATKPLLHTWSLGVEEQFYLVWPALIFLCVLYLKRAHILAVLTALIVVGLLAAEYVLKKDVDAAFYLTPFRLSEFGIGAVLVWLDKYRPSKTMLVELIFVLGLALTLVPIFLYTDQIRFPGLTAFIPCFGAALLIFVAPASKLKSLLANRAMVAIGLISYSLYLVHWPLYVFAKQVIGDISLAVASGLILASIVLAAVSYRFVETPFRRSTDKPNAYKYLGTPIGYLVSALILLSVSASAMFSNGWQGRFSAQVNELVSYREDFKTTNRMGSCYQVKKATWQDIPRTCYDPSLLPDNGKPTYLLVGSSFSADLWPGLSQVLTEVNLLQISKAGCFFTTVHLPKNTQTCNDHNRFVFDTVLKNYRYDLVLISTAGVPGRPWDQTKAMFETYDQDYVVFGMRPKFSEMPQTLAANYGRREGLEAELTRFVSYKNDARWRAALPPEKFFSIEDAICPTKTTCQWVVGNHLTYRDKTHFNTEGSVVVAEVFKKWLAER